MKNERLIKQMPDRDTLEEFIKGMNGEDGIKVVFNKEKGEFEWLEERPLKEVPFGEPKTELGWKLRRL